MCMCMCRFLCACRCASVHIHTCCTLHRISEPTSPAHNMHTYMHTHTHARTRTHTHAHTHARTHACMRAHANAHAHAHRHTHARTHACMHTCRGSELPMPFHERSRALSRWCPSIDRTIVGACRCVSEFHYTHTHVRAHARTRMCTHACAQTQHLNKPTHTLTVGWGLGSMAAGRVGQSPS